MKFHKSNAVSPLIATLLIIAVALVVAGIMMTWSTSFFSARTTEIDKAVNKQINCAYAGIALSDCNFTASTDLLTFKISNTGNQTLNGDFNIVLDDGNTTVVKAYYTPNLARSDIGIVDSGNTTTFVLTSGTMSQLSKIGTLKVTPSDCPSQSREMTTCTNT